MTKKIIRLTEGDLHRIVKESVNRILSEIEVPNLDKASSDNFWDIVDSGGYYKLDDKGIEKEASWRALADQIPSMPSKDYWRERFHLTDKEPRGGCRPSTAYVKGRDFKDK